MKFCHKCRAQCEDGAKFCKQCGAALADVNANQSQQTYEVPRQAQYTSADTNNSQNAYGNQNTIVVAFKIITFNNTVITTIKH